MTHKLYVTNVPTLVDLAAIFGPYGTVRSSRTASTAGPNGPAKAALVEMGSEAQVTAAITAVDGRLYGGRILGVCRATARHESDADHTSLFGPMNMTADGPPRPGDGAVDGGGGGDNGPRASEALRPDHTWVHSPPGEWGPFHPIPARTASVGSAPHTDNDGPI